MFRNRDADNFNVIRMEDEQQHRAAAEHFQERYADTRTPATLMPLEYCNHD
jgi:hypothetical protein